MTSNVEKFIVCEQEGVLKSMRLLGYVVLICKILIPIIIIIKGIIILFNAVTADDEKEIKTATTSLIKKIILGIIIAFIPSIVYAVFKLVLPSYNGFTPCFDCMNEPTGLKCESYIKLSKMK